MVEEQLIMKVRINKQTGQKLITIPKSSNIKDGDYVSITKVVKS
jgi:hypothetical protein